MKEISGFIPKIRGHPHPISGFDTTIRMVRQFGVKYMWTIRFILLGLFGIKEGGYEDNSRYF